jgi:hypothetical protein
VPLPDGDTLSDVADALAATLSLADFVATANGVKVTEMLQLVSAGRLAGACWNGPGQRRAFWRKFSRQSSSLADRLHEQQ